MHKTYRVLLGFTIGYDDERTGKGGSGLGLGRLETAAEYGARVNALLFSLRKGVHETGSNADTGATTTPVTRPEDAPWKCVVCVTYPSCDSSSWKNVTEMAGGSNRLSLYEGRDRLVGEGVSAGEEGAVDAESSASEKERVLGVVVYRSKISERAGEEGEELAEDEGEDVVGDMSARCGATERGGGCEKSSNSISSSFTSNGMALGKKRVPDEAEPPGALARSRSLKTISSCVESHSAVNVHAVDELGGVGPTTGEFGRFRCTPLRSATLLRIFFTLGCGTETAYIWSSA